MNRRSIIKATTLLPLGMSANKSLGEFSEKPIEFIELEGIKRFACEHFIARRDQITYKDYYTALKNVDPTDFGINVEVEFLNGLVINEDFYYYNQESLRGKSKFIFDQFDFWKPSWIQKNTRRIEVILNEKLEPEKCLFRDGYKPTKDEIRANYLSKLEWEISNKGQ